MSETKRFAYLKEAAIGGGVGLVVLALVILGFSVSGSVSPSGTSSNNSANGAASTSPSATPSASLCSVQDQMNDERLGNVQAILVNAANDQVLLDYKGEQASATASTMKLLTAAAAMQILGPNYRIQTRVYKDSADAGTIYLVGGGDVTLSRTMPGKQSVYQDAPKLNDLAVQVNKALAGTNITKIVADGSLFKGPQWLAGVKQSEQTNGYLSYTSALQVDGDRNDPKAETSPRSSTPELRAGTWLKQAIGSAARSATVVTGTLPSSAVQIATVSSQPISNWINHMLTVSDNTQAEALARLTSIDQGFDGSFASLDASTKKALATLGLDTTGITIMDGSGESTQNAVSPAFMVKLLKQIAAGSGNLAVVKQSLPVAGESGSLQNRFNGPNVDAAGHVFAKTGWIDHGYTLAGYIMPKDGSTLLFAVYALGPKVKDDAKVAIDNLVTNIYRCGSALGPVTQVTPGPAASPTPAK
jgi:D-alanyl-D-alanine carboxypeptidase/D-alanyl-D-alanine-endopeptidase (penicillin-binding protein 4)